MTTPPFDPKIALLKLTDELVDDLLSLSDDDFIAECKNSFTPEASEKVGKEILEKAEIIAAKRKLLAAKAAVSEGRKSSKSLHVLSAAQARERFDKAVKENPNLIAGLTLAARKGTGHADADLISIVEDLEELGLIPPTNNDK